MIQGLEALHHPRIKTAKVDISAETKQGIGYMFFGDTKQYTAIENELKDYQQHEEILNDYGLTLANFREACLLLAMLKGEGRNIHDINKQLKTLEVIKKHVIKIGGESGNFNGNNIILIGLKNITQEEYDLLKGVLL